MRRGFAAMAQTLVLVGGVTTFGIDAGPARAQGPRGGARPADGTPSTGKPASLREVGIDQRLGQAVPLDLEFVSAADGRTHRLGEYFGQQPVVLVPAYYRCPMLCPMLIHGVARSLKPLELGAGRDFQVVVFSFDPREGPADARLRRDEALERYGREGSVAGWHFLTGDREAIRRLTEAIGFHYRFMPERDEYAHAATIVLLTPGGEISRYLYGVEFAPRDLRLALVESSAGEIGDVVDRALLYCFRYDPTSGRYSAAVMNLVRLGGGLTLLVLAGLAFVAWRRGRFSISESSSATTGA